MIKKKISKRPKTCKKDMNDLKRHCPEKAIKEMTPSNLLDVLVSCLNEGDPEAFKEVLWAYLNVHNKAKIARSMKVSRATLYNIISEEGNPTLDVLAKLFKAISEYEEAA